MNAIFISIDANFVKYGEVFLKALSKNYPNHPDIILCHSGVKKTELSRLKNLTHGVRLFANTLSLSECGPIMEHLPEALSPKSFYARFLLFDSYFDCYENILHLDADILVLSSLEELFTKDEFLMFEDIYKGEDHTFKDHKCNELKKLLKADEIRLSSTLGNAGVFLLPKRYRTSGQRKLLSYLTDRYRNHIRWADQSVLNVWMRVNRIEVEKGYQYNFQHRLLTDVEGNTEKLKNAFLFHFSGVEEERRLDLMRKVLKIGDLPGWEEVYQYSHKQEDVKPISYLESYQKKAVTLRLAA